MNTLAAVSAQIASLSFGNRSWFWLCPGLDALPTLLLAPFRGDPQMRKLKATVQGTVIPSGHRPIIGLCVVGEDGVFRFAAQDADHAALRVLADWVLQHAADHPTLRRLCGARMLVVNGRMKILETIEDASVWAGIVPMSPPGTLEDAVQTVHGMAPGAQAWFWATRKGPAKKPLLIVEPAPEGASIDALNRRVEGALRRTTAPGVSARGLIVCQGNGQMAVHTDQSEKRARAVFRTLGNAERHLRWMYSPRPDVEDDLSQTIKALAGLARGWWFCGVRAKEGDIVLIDPEKEGLKAQMKANGLTPRDGLTGEYRAGDAQLDFAISAVSPAILPTILPTIARWIARHQGSHPDVRKLIGVRLIVRGPDGRITARHRGPEAWTAL